jgi:hypothetical protein
MLWGVIVGGGPPWPPLALKIQPRWINGARAVLLFQA